MPHSPVWSAACVGTRQASSRSAAGLVLHAFGTVLTVGDAAAPPRSRFQIYPARSILENCFAQWLRGHQPIVLRNPCVTAMSFRLSNMPWTLLLRPCLRRLRARSSFAAHCIHVLLQVRRQVPPSRTFIRGNIPSSVTLVLGAVRRWLPFSAFQNIFPAVCIADVCGTAYALTLVGVLYNVLSEAQGESMSGKPRVQVVLRTDSVALSVFTARPTRFS